MIDRTRECLLIESSSICICIARKYDEATRMKFKFQLSKSGFDFMDELISARSVVLVWDRSFE